MRVTPGESVNSLNSNAGDSGRFLSREELASFVLERREQIRAIARAKLPRGVRSVFDSEDVVSTVLRRVDGMIQSGALRARTFMELESLIGVVAENVSITKSRLVEIARHRRLDNESIWEMLEHRAERCAGNEEAAGLLFKMLGSLDGADQRQMFLLRFRGASHRVVARQLGIAEDACRKRWSTVCQSLNERFSGAPGHDLA
ncbi:MAG: sigma-70 family RNA polymerase sigma factor [Phycisphaeraceae bacterium]|nr:sigma-70 family RNA polymerase sigma factor [Phycisphaeraceae bacterium]